MLQNSGVIHGPQNTILKEVKKKFIQKNKFLSIILLYSNLLLELSVVNLENFKEIKE